MPLVIEPFFNKNSALSVEYRKSGNQLYRQKNHEGNVHKEILLLYSKSITFATTEEELALGYANRSALFLHLSEYDRCLFDIEQALKITTSERLKSKLDIRKDKCMEGLRNQATTSQATTSQAHSPVLPTFTESPTVPNASDAVIVKHDDKFGRHMIATRDIKPWEVIVAERGYLCYPIIAKRHFVCSHCLSLAWNGIPCDRCAFAIYCSETCKSDAWSEYHDIECRTLFSSFVPPSLFQNGMKARNFPDYQLEKIFMYLLAVMRLLIKAVKSEGVDVVIREFHDAKIGKYKGIEKSMFDGKLRTDKFRSCVNLLSMPNLGEFVNDSLVEEMAKMLFDRSGLFDSRENVIDDRRRITQLLKKLIGIFNCNVFQYQSSICRCGNEEDCEINCNDNRGLIFAPLSSLLNHGCYYNVERMFLPNGKLVIFTIAPIKQGEQVFLSYGISLEKEKQERQHYLLIYFRFLCKCQACEEKWPSYREQLQRTERERDDLQIGRWEFKEEILKRAADLIDAIYRRYEDNSVSAWYYSCKVKCYLLKAVHTIYGEKFALRNECTHTS